MLDITFVIYLHCSPPYSSSLFPLFTLFFISHCSQSTVNKKSHRGNDNLHPNSSSSAPPQHCPDFRRVNSYSRRSRSRPPCSRFVQKVVRDKGAGYSWIVDHQFDIANHVISAALDEVRSPEELRRYVSQMADRKLSWDRPLWELHVIGWQPSPTTDGTKNDVITLALLRLHPVVSDGIKLMRLICCRLADDDEYSASVSGWRTTARCHYGRLAYTFNVVRALFVGKSTGNELCKCIYENDRAHGKRSHSLP